MLSTKSANSTSYKNYIQQDVNAVIIVFIKYHSILNNVVIKYNQILLGVVNGKSDTVQDAEMAFLKSEPETFESNELTRDRDLTT